MWHEYMHKTPLKLLSSTFSPLPPILSLSLSPCLPCFASELAAAALPPRLPLELADAAAPRSSRTSLPPGARGRRAHRRPWSSRPPPGSPVELASHVRRRRSLRASPARPRRRSSNSPTISPLPPRQRSPSSARTTAAALLATPTRAAAAWLAAPAQTAASELAAPTSAAAAWLAALASGEGRARG